MPGSRERSERLAGRTAGITRPDNRPRRKQWMQPGLRTRSDCMNRCRWLVEERHRVLKEGCKLERSQLDDAADIQRPAAIQSIISVRMIKLRALAGFGEEDDNELSGVPCRGGAESDDPQALQNTVPWTWILVVTALSGMNPSRQNPAPVLARYCHPGWLHWPGYIGRKSDGRPGWKVIRRGWYEVTMMVRGAEMSGPDPGTPNCGSR